MFQSPQDLSSPGWKQIPLRRCCPVLRSKSPAKPAVPLHPSTTHKGKIRPLSIHASLPAWRLFPREVLLETPNQFSILLLLPAPFQPEFPTTLSHYKGSSHPVRDAQIYSAEARDFSQNPLLYCLNNPLSAKWHTLQIWHLGSQKVRKSVWLHPSKAAPKTNTPPLRKLLLFCLKELAPMLA